MQRLLGFPVRFASMLGRRFKAFLGDRRANIAALSALMVIPITGAAGLAIETSGWYMTQRLLQNAADSAVLSAAQDINSITCAAGGPDCGVYPNGTPIITSCTTVGHFDCEAVAAAQKFGLVDQANNVFVEAHYYTSASGKCTVSNTACYMVTIRKKVPLTFMKIIGYGGDATIGATKAVLIKASAMASAGASVGYCMISLDSSSKNGSGITINGGGGVGSQTSVDLGGCDIFSNGNQACNGGGANKGFFGINYGVTALSAAQGCGANTVARASTITEASLSWDSLYTNFPTPLSACGASGGAGYHYLTDTAASPGGAFTAPAAANNHLSGGVVLPALKVICGDVKLDGDVTITSATPGSVLLIENGTFETNGHNLTAPSTSGLTIAFSGDAGDTHLHYFQDSCPSCTSTISYSAPSDTSDVWRGVAFYQDPQLTDAGGSNDMVYTGSAYQIDVTGLFYMPKASVTIKGAINHATDGLACIAFITLDTLVSGNGSIFPNPTSQCNLAGLSLPSSPETKRAALIQ